MFTHSRRGWAHEHTVFDNTSSTCSRVKRAALDDELRTRKDSRPNAGQNRSRETPHQDKKCHTQRGYGGPEHGLCTAAPVSSTSTSPPTRTPGFRTKAPLLFPTTHSAPAFPRSTLAAPPTRISLLRLASLRRLFSPFSLPLSLSCLLLLLLRAANLSCLPSFLPACPSPSPGLGGLFLPHLELHVGAPRVVLGLPLHPPLEDGSGLRGVPQHLLEDGKTHTSQSGATNSSGEGEGGGGSPIELHMYPTTT